MSFKMLIGVKNKGFLVPEDVVKRMLTKYKSCAGFIITKDGEIQTAFHDKPMDVPAFNSMQEQLKEDTVPFFLGAFDKAFSAADIQPFPLVTDAEDNVVVSCFVESDGLMDFHSTQSPNSKEFEFMKEYLAPKLKLEYMQLGNKVGDLMTKLRTSKLIGVELNNMLMPRGSLLFVANTGELVTLGKNDKGGAWDWGVLSDSMGFKTGEKAETVTSKTVNAVTGMFAKAKAIASTEPVKVASSAVHVPAAATPIKTETAIAEKLTAAAAAKAADTVKRFEIPVGLNHKNRKKWIMSNLGHHPPKWDSAKGWDVYFDADGKRIKVVDFRDQGVESAAETVVEETTRQVKNTAPSVVKSEHALPIASKKIASAAPAEPIALIPVEEKKDIIEKFLTQKKVQSAIDEGREEILHPKQMQGLETKADNFFSQLGMKGVSDVLGWDLEMRDEFCETYPQAAVVLIGSLTDLIRQQNYEISQLTKPAPTVEPKKEETVVDIAPAPRKSRFARG